VLSEPLASLPELSWSWFGYPSSMVAPENLVTVPRKGGRK
jgi:hypothetical protein